MANDGVSRHFYSPRQRAEGVESFAFILAVGICAVLCVFFACDTVGGEKAAGAKLEDRINPNYAAAASMRRLPGVGIARAQAIVDYREAAADETGEKIVFKDCDDMQKVHGIGPKTAENMKQWLEFE